MVLEKGKLGDCRALYGTGIVFCYNVWRFSAGRSGEGKCYLLADFINNFVNFITYIQMALLAYRFPKVWILAFLPCATSYALSYGRMDIPWFMSIYFQERFLFVYGNEKCWNC